jgi:beta-1,2-mannobiose phosphorylase / 1,2-beta-oligomannan phosphorylase
MIDKILLKPGDFKPHYRNWKINGIFNPAAIRDKSGKIVLYIRVAETFFSKNKLEYPVMLPGKEHKYEVKKIEDDILLQKEGNVLYLKNNTVRLSNISHFRKIELDETGLNVVNIEKEPIFFPEEEYEECGVEDPRIVKIGSKFYMTYVSVSILNGITTSLAVSKNLVKWERIGIIFNHENKDVTLFPGKINGEYVALHRPVGNFNFNNPSIWISYSKDLIYWGKSRCIMHPRRDSSWDNIRIGAGCPPIKTKKGWLEIYHGVNNKTYSAGAVLFDLKNPERIIAQTPIHKPLFSPNKKYEKKGFVNNVIFPTGIIKDIDDKSVLIYSGAADRLITVKKIEMSEILDSLEYVD